MQNLGVIPFIKQQNNTVKQWKTMKNEMESYATYLFLVELLFFQALGMKATQLNQKQIVFSLFNC